MIIDTFLYYNEEIPVEVRINELKDVVDKFVVVSGSTTLTGNSNPYRLPKHLMEVADIEYHVIDIPSGLDRFPAEYWLRERIREQLQKFSPSDMMIMSDADETLAADVVVEVDGTYNMEVDQYYYNFDTFMRQSTYPFMCRVGDLGDIYAMRNHYMLPVLEACGWEFSFFGDAEWVHNKLKNYSHDELAADPNFGDIDKIKARIEKGADIVDRPVTGQPKRPLPKYVLDNKDRFKDYFK